MTNVIYFWKFMAFSILLRTGTVGSEVSFIIYSVPSTPSYLCCTFCGNFCKARKNIPVFEMIPRSYSISYFSLFLIFTLSHATQVNILHTLYLLLHTYFREYLLNFEKIYFCSLLKLHFSPNLSLLMRTSQFLQTGATTFSSSHIINHFLH